VGVVPGRGRMRIVARPGLSTYAGPTGRQLFIARLVPLLAPLVFQVLSVAGLHLSPLFYFLSALALLLSARNFMETGIGLGILMPIQLFAGLLATALLGMYTLSHHDWLRHSGNTVLMMGYVSFLFNLIGSYLPR
jgi:hypothetical protein